MSITRTTTRWTYTPNGVTTSFAFDNLVQASGDLHVSWYDSAGSALVLPSYSITGIGNPTGGAVVFATAPATVAGSKIVLERITGSVTTGADQANFIQETAETRQYYRDKGLALAQEASAKFLRTFVLSPLDPDGALVLPPPALRANKALLFGADGAPVVGSPLTAGAATISAFVQTMLDDADAAAVLTTLGFSTFMKALRSADAAAALTALGFSSYAAATLIGLADAAALRTAAGVLFGRCNRLINGDMEIDQRNEGASQTFTAAAAIAYCLDRWYASCTGANITGQRVAGTAPNRYAWRFTGATSNTGLLFGQRIEAADIADLVSTDVTVSLLLKSSSLTSLAWKAYYANAADDFSSKTLISSGTISGISSTLAAKSFGFNLGANAGNGVALEFEGGALVAAQTLQLEAVQLERGTVVSAFERRGFRERLADCQRFYEKSYAPGTALGAATALGIAGIGVTLGAGVGACAGFVPFKVTKRGTPSAVAYWDAAGNASKISTAAAQNTSLTSNLAALAAPFDIGAGGFLALGYNGGTNLTSLLHYAATAEL